ncbi:unnamed protein product, partial [Symbiodinium sp. CCMP2456]
TAGAFVRIAHRLIHRRHFLAIYVDDILALFRRSEASTGAVLVVFLATALGVPISWKKLVLGSCVKWLGWMVRLGEAPTAHLPEDKRIRLLGALQLLRVAGAMVSRKHLEQLVGLLSWFVSGVRWLRPWLRQLFHLLHKPSVVLRALDSAQLTEISQVVSLEGEIHTCPFLSDVMQGWRILEVGHVPSQGPRDLLKAQVKQGRAWVKFGDGCSKEVRVSKEEAQVADFYHSLVSKNVEVQLVHKKGPHVLAAADAYAAELPDWFVQEHGRSDLQKYICALEALAQLVLSKSLIADSRVGPTFSCVGQVVLRQSCDNSGVCGAVSKASSMRRPLADVLQAMAMLCMQRQVVLQASHVAGQRNTWADLLSRGRAANGSPEFWASLDSRRSRTADWHRLLDAGQLSPLR